MKLPITIAAICALTVNASSISAVNLSKWYKRAPKSLKRGGTRVDRDKTVTGYDYDSIPPDNQKCEDGAIAFDAYCHGDKNPRKYADYRNGEDGSCDYDGLAS